MCVESGGDDGNARVRYIVIAFSEIVFGQLGAPSDSFKD